MVAIVFFCTAGFFGAIATAPLWVDRAIVWVLRTFHLFLFPNAIRLAVSLERDTAEWTYRKYQAEHPKIGTIWIGNCAYGINVKIIAGDETLEWKPNWIERRIIRDAWTVRSVGRSIGTLKEHCRHETCDARDSAARVVSLMMLG